MIMQSKPIRSFEYKNAFLYVVIREEPRLGPDSYLYCCGINLSRFCRLSWRKAGICSNAAVRGIQLLRTFAAFPGTYAHMFSYLYSALLLLLFALMVKHVHAQNHDRCGAVLRADRDRLQDMGLPDIPFPRNDRGSDEKRPGLLTFPLALPAPEGKESLNFCITGDR